MSTSCNGLNWKIHILCLPRQSLKTLAEVSQEISEFTVVILLCGRLAATEGKSFLSPLSTLKTSSYPGWIKSPHVVTYHT